MESRGTPITNTDILERISKRLTLTALSMFCLNVALWELYQIEADPEREDEHRYTSNWWQNVASEDLKKQLKENSHDINLLES